MVYRSDGNLYSSLCLVHRNTYSREITLGDAGTLPNVLVVIVHCLGYIANVQPIFKPLPYALPLLYQLQQSHLGSVLQTLLGTPVFLYISQFTSSLIDS
jgi:hypothetical protein